MTTVSGPTNLMHFECLLRPVQVSSQYRSCLARSADSGKSFYLDLVLSADDPQSTEMAYALINSHPDAQLSIFQRNALLDGQHPETTPLTGSIASSQDSLSTGVLVGRNSELDSILSAVIGMEGK